jgi:hypothetical protein
MGFHSSSDIPCRVCSKPVDLTVDLYADEFNKPVHEDCYVKHLVEGERKADLELSPGSVSSLFFPYSV